MPNRKKQPHIHAIQNLQLPLPKKHTLQNGIPVYEINMGTQDVTKLEIVFKAGRPSESKHLTARVTARMLREGTRQHSSAEIAEIMDYYGGTMGSPVNLDTANIVLYSLNKHLEKLIPLVAEVVSTPTFPQEELDTVVTNSVQQIKVNETKCDVVAYREITERIFTSAHPYGYNSTVEAYRDLKQADLFRHFETNYHAANCTIIVSGRIVPSTIQLLDDYFGTLIPQGTPAEPQFTAIQTNPRSIHIDLEGSQTAIRIGCRMFNKKHPDYNGLFVLNTILGGYFGSRLMMNIREDKGYTYNIFSGLDSMLYDGYFTIGTEVGNEHVGATLAEIYKEVEVLQNELVGKEELEMVRNYLLGNMLTMLDGPMNIADIIKSMVVEDLDFSTFSKIEHTINTITAEELRTLAQRYLVKENMWEVVVGR